ncbi:MAG TPA: DUF2783 domain-containing protein [Hyphomicrobiaceae bacterium]|nr:DUF2783 domain-containing protein [Hyphomicrobiaceae bacterium]
MTRPDEPALRMQSTLRDPDAVYRSLVEAHRGLSADQSAALNAALVLILANQTGDDDAVRAAIDLARATLETAADGGG